MIFCFQFIYVGVVSSIETNHKNVTEARKGMEVCIKIENVPGETPKLYGRHFDHEDLLMSKVTKQILKMYVEEFLYSWESYNNNFDRVVSRS